MRMVVGTVGSGSVALEHVLSQSITGDGANDQMDSQQLTNVIRALASKAGVTGGEILVAVGRSRVELRNMMLPMGDPDDLPDMVRFTAMRQFANVGDTWPIDFAPLPQTDRSVVDGAEMQEVVAMTINPSTISQIRKVCLDAGFTVTQIGLRPMASGTLADAVANSPVGKNSTVLLIDILADEADMVVLEKGHVSFMRTVRMATDDNGERGPLPIGEIRRTMIAAMNARPGLEIERIVLWSDPAAADASVQAWRSELEVPVEAINPFSLIELKKSVEPTNDTGRFAPLIGLLLQRKLSPKSKPAPSFIDFLHPRHRSEKKKPIREYILAGAAATILVGGGLWWYRSSHQALDAKIAELTKNFSEMEPSLKLAVKNSDDWKKVEGFLSGDIQWLDELSFLSKQALPPDQMVVLDANIVLNAVTNSGEVKTKVAITDQKLGPKLEEDFRDRKHQVGTKGVNRNPDPKSAYRWTVDPLVTVASMTVVDPTTLPPQPKLESKNSVPPTTIKSNESQPSDSIPNDAAPNDAAPNDAAPNDAVPEGAVPKDAVEKNDPQPSANDVTPVTNEEAPRT